MLVMGLLVAVLHQLMGSGNSFETIGVVKLHGIILSEGPPSTSGTHIEPKSFIGVAPQQVANRTFMWHLLEPI